MSTHFTYHQSPSSSSPTRIRQEGFQVPSTGSPSLNAPPSPTTQYDPQNNFFAGSHSVFPNAFKKLNDRSAIDFSDTLASILAPDSPDDLHLHRSNSHITSPGLHQQQQHQQHQQSVDLTSSANSTGSQFFDISSFPSQFASFNRHGGPATSGTSDLSTPSLHDSTSTGLSVLNNSSSSLNYLSGDPSLSFHPQNGPTRHPPPPQHQRAHTISFPSSATGMRPVLPRLNSVRTSSPATSQSLAGTSSDPQTGLNMIVPSSPYDPFPPLNAGAGVSMHPHLSNAVSGVSTTSGPPPANSAQGVQPSSGAVRRSSSRSRSRSRPATSGAMSSSGVAGIGMAVPSGSAGAGGSSSGGRASSRVGTKKRAQSISSPSPPAGTTASSVASNAPINHGTGAGASGRPGPMSIVIPEVPNHMGHARQHSQGQGLVSPTTTTSWMFSPGSAQTAYSLPNGPNLAAIGDMSSSYGATSYISQSVPHNGILVDEDKTPPTKEDVATKQAALINEKRRKRRESHNAVERRRRDNINEKISELATLIPECLLLEGGSTTPNAATGPSAAGGGPLSSSTVNNTSNPSADMTSGGLSASPPMHNNGLVGVGDDGVPIKSEILQENLQLGNGELAIPPPPPAPGAVALSAVVDENSADQQTLKANKGVILKKSVDYIRYLQQLVRVQSEKNRDLEVELAHYRTGGVGAPPSGPRSSFSSGDSHHSQSGMQQLSNEYGPALPGAAGSDPLNGLMYPDQHHHQQQQQGPNGEFVGPNEYSTFDFGGNSGDLGLGGLGGGHHHLVSVKEEDGASMMDMNVIGGPEDFSTPPSDHSHPGSAGHTAHGLQHHQLQQHHDFFSQNGHPYDMAAFPPTTPNLNGVGMAPNPQTPGSYHPHFPSPLHQQQQPQPQQQQQQQHRSSSLNMDGSPSGVGSGSGVSDLEDVEEEDEGGDASGAGNGGAGDEQEGRGRKRFQQSSSSIGPQRSVSRSAGGRKLRNQSLSRGPGPLRNQPTTSASDDLMNVDERQ